MYCWDYTDLADTTFNELRSKRRYGVELEYQDAPDYDDLEGMTVFGCKEDGSIDGPEFYSPPMRGDAGLEACRELCSYGASHEFTTPRGTGLHLHMDLQSETIERIKSLALAYHYTRPIWFGCMPSHRRESTWCSGQCWTSDTFRNLVDIDELRQESGYCDRYNWLNWAAYLDHGTVEMRLHESTTNGEDVVGWIVANLSFADAVSDLSVAQIFRVFLAKSAKEIFHEMVCIIQNPIGSAYLRRRYNRYATR